MRSEEEEGCEALAVCGSEIVHQRRRSSLVLAKCFCSSIIVVDCLLLLLFSVDVPIVRDQLCICNNAHFSGFGAQFEPPVDVGSLEPEPR